MKNPPSVQSAPSTWVVHADQPSACTKGHNSQVGSGGCL